MFNNEPLLTFKAQIKVGAALGQDHGYYRWPNAAHPQKPSDKGSAEMEFDVAFDGRHFDLTRPGYGQKHPNYGNGGIYVYNIDDLIVAPKDRQRVIDYLVGEKKKQIEKAAADMAKLHSEMEALALSRPSREAPNE